MRVLAMTLVAGSVAGCLVADDDDAGGAGGKADGNGTCVAPEYGDGTCHIDLACEVPDIDCFQTFDTDDAAATWLTTQMGYTRVPATDPRTVRARALLDRAVELYKSRVQLGTLADKRIALVVLDDQPGAFIVGDYMTHKGAWSVQVQSGMLVDAYTDEQIIGVMQHELTHLSKLHFLDEIVDRIRKYYVAPADSEPIGAQVEEHANARTIGDAWRKLAVLAGSYSHAELGALPYSGRLMALFEDVLYRANTSCPTEVNAIYALYDQLKPASLDQTLTVPADFATRAMTALDAARTCTATEGTFATYLAGLGTEWDMYVRALLSAEEMPLLEQPAYDAMLAIVRTRREQMRALEQRFAKELGRPWSALRYFSYEEQADDNWVRIFTSSKLDGAASVRGTFLNMLETDAPACEQALAASAPVPYGINYTDEHHGTCWRIAHARQLASTATSTERRLEIDTVERVPHVPVQRPRLPGERMY